MDEGALLSSLDLSQQVCQVHQVRTKARKNALGGKFNSSPIFDFTRLRRRLPILVLAGHLDSAGAITKELCGRGHVHAQSRQIFLIIVFVLPIQVTGREIGGKAPGRRGARAFD
jgi:hypothetical protein